MNVKKVIEILNANPQFENDPAGFLIFLNQKSTKGPKTIIRTVGQINTLVSIADSNGGDATQEDVEAAIAYKQKKDGKIK